MILSDGQIRKTLIGVVVEFQREGPGTLQMTGVLDEAARLLGIRRGDPNELALLDVWHELFIENTLAWGHDLHNSRPPFLHITRKGRAALGLED